VSRCNGRREQGPGHRSDESDASKRAHVRMELASGYFERGQMTTALDQVKLAIVADPTFAEAFNLRGLIYANLGDERLAEESFRRALQLNSRDADTMQNLGISCQRSATARRTHFSIKPWPCRNTGTLHAPI